MKGKWVKDMCPFARDQGFDSVIGNVQPGETVFGFTHTMAAANETLIFATETARELGIIKGKGIQGQRVIHQMADLFYRIVATKVAGTSEGASTYEVTKGLTGFVFYGDNTATYDIIVIGRVKF